MRRPAARTSLGRNRDFLILWSGEAASALGASMSMLVFPLIGYAVTGSPAQAGLATTAVLLGEVAARLPAGAHAAIRAILLWGAAINFSVNLVLAIGTFLLPANNSGISAYQVTVTPDRLQGRVNSAGGFIAMGAAPIMRA